MSDFFKSEMVRGDLQEMAELQQFCMRSMVAFPVLPKEKKLQYFEVMEQLIEKQKIFYARISLSDDPEATEVAESLRQSTIMMMGGDDSKPVNTILDELLERVRYMKSQLEAQGG